MSQRTVFLVVGRHWDYDDEHWYGEDTPVVAYRTRAAADAECLRRMTEEWGPENAPALREWLHTPRGQQTRSYVVVETTVEE